ncbi:hypothetical protein HXX76_013936 [Chlamydomonas incerta]|uniref:AB hydrolase-1 domain-containing protein n=1 Tax=Chlamydomonas incerta TaxID=51695 RepID=A0A835SDB3_CHLIN|nr:hypothetical protein HXX76_013936 [Chlamydomonas incerta]|eukprot:KAG2425182.1 hypothetical protein HXX76_013936 [Chlamydomonas incerta]
MVELPGRGVALEVDIHRCSAAPGSSRDRAAGRAGAGPAAAATAATAAVDGRPVLVVLHPWAWLGGCMDDHVVVSVCRAAISSRHFSCVVRYNMRGAGQSGGSRAFFPSADADDLEALVQHLLPGTGAQQQLQPPPPQQQQQPAMGASGLTAPGAEGAGEPQQRLGQRPRLAVVAYSYGGVVAGRALAALRPHLAALALIGFPMGKLCRIFLGSGPAWEALSGSGSAATAATVAGLPRLACCGAYDQFTDVRQLTAAVDKANRRSAAAPGSRGPGPAAGAAACASDSPGSADADASGAIQLAIWPGCDHFFGSCLDPEALAASGLVPPAELPEDDEDGAARGGGAAAGGQGPLSAGYTASWLATRRPAVPLAEYVVRWLGRVCAGPQAAAAGAGAVKGALVGVRGGVGGAG